MDIDFERKERKRRRNLVMMVTIVVVIALILASLYYFLVFNMEDEEKKKEILTTTTPYNGGYPNDNVTFSFTIYNPEKEDDIYAPILSGIPSDWEIQLPSTITVEGKESKTQKFTITPSLATGLNNTYPFTVDVTSGNTQVTYTLDFEIVVYELLVDVELISDARHQYGYPNQNISYNFSIYNPNEFVDVFTPSIAGLPSDWQVTLPNNVTVSGNDTNDGQLQVIPTESALNKTYSFDLLVTSKHSHRPYFLKYNLTVMQTYGTRIVCYNNSHDADPGRPAYYALLVENAGNGQDTFSLSYNHSHLPENWSVSFEFNSVTLGGFESKVVICTINTHSDTSMGRYDIDFTATSENGPKATVRLNTSLITEFDDVTIDIGDKGQVNYIGTLMNGIIFDTSYYEIATNPNYLKDQEFQIRPSYSPLKIVVGGSDPDTTDDYGRMIDGFWEGVVGMKENETRVIRIPPEKAYTYPGNEAHHLYGETLIFEITLVSIDG
jgi:uncharacterized membrane protein